MEVALFAAVVGVIVVVLFRAPLGPRRAWRWAPPACALLFIASWAAATLLSAADAPGKKPRPKTPKGAAAKKLVKPANWPAGHPLPLVASNCAACHLTAGRELTAAVVNFTRSVHDRSAMSCSDCHGGNTEDDVQAHEAEFGFIGTKKSAHIEGCSACHTEAAELLASGPHNWDFSKKINTEYPMCFDCHGNHDIGNPPADFKLAQWCGDCHDKPAKTFPNLAAVVDENDRMWDVLRKVHQKNIALAENPVPPPFRQEVDALRNATMQAIHKSREITADEAAKLNGRAAALRNGLEKWLQSNP